MKAKPPKDAPKKCGAKNRPGAKHAYCQDSPTPGRERCRRHGGETPRGPDSPHWRHGDKARHEPIDLSLLYQEAAGDPELMRFKHDAALLETLRRALTQKLKVDKTVPAAMADRILALTDGLRKIKEAEQRRLQVLQQMVPLEQHRRAMAATAAIVFEVVKERLDRLEQALGDLASDPKIRKHLNAIDWTQDMAVKYRIAALRTPAIMAVEGRKD